MENREGVDRAEAVKIEEDITINNNEGEVITNSSHTNTSSMAITKVVNSMANSSRDQLLRSSQYLSTHSPA